MTDNFRSGFCSVVGRPNVGKSTLINALTGEKVAITSPKPQTTRKQQLAILTGDGYQIVFVDRIVFLPFVKLLSGSVNLVLRILGIDPNSPGIPDREAERTETARAPGSCRYRTSGPHPARRRTPSKVHPPGCP